MSDKEYVVYLATSDPDRKLYVSLSEGETVWDMTTDILWTEKFSLDYAESVRDAGRAELGLELKIEEVEADD
nr:MAG TPA: hypothetical protein [Caudoviricetes sp.]